MGEGSAGSNLGLLLGGWATRRRLPSWGMGPGGDSQSLTLSPDLGDQLLAGPMGSSTKRPHSVSAVYSLPAPVMRAH
jgi:hypothetical protein